jgi:L-serine deaminase
MSNKKTEHLEQIKEKIGNADLSEEEKSNSFKHIEEWYAEDKAFGALYEKLAEISPKIESILAEMGLI